MDSFRQYPTELTTYLRGSQSILVDLNCDAAQSQAMIFERCSSHTDQRTVFTGIVNVTSEASEMEETREQTTRFPWLEVRWFGNHVNNREWWFHR